MNNAGVWAVLFFSLIINSRIGTEPTGETNDTAGSVSGYIP